MSGKIVLLLTDNPWIMRSVFLCKGILLNRFTAISLFKAYDLTRDQQLFNNYPAKSRGISPDT